MVPGAIKAQNITKPFIIFDKDFWNTPMNINAFKKRYNYSQLRNLIYFTILQRGFSQKHCWKRKHQFKQDFRNEQIQESQWSIREPGHLLLSGMNIMGCGEPDFSSWLGASFCFGIYSLLNNAPFFNFFYTLSQKRWGAPLSFSSQNFPDSATTDYFENDFSQIAYFLQRIKTSGVWFSHLVKDPVNTLPSTSAMVGVG